MHAGYRLLDCAAIYTNEALVGEAISRVISEEKVKREELFVVTKLWMDSFKDPEAALRASMEKLQVSYVDCYMVHWPAGFFQEDPENRVPMHVLWPKLEALVDAGLVKSLGISNFNLQMIADLLCYCRVKPVVNEVELNPTNTQETLLAFLKSQSIVPIGYIPVCRPGDHRTEAVWSDLSLEQICSHHGKSRAQVMLNWAVARGTVPIPRSGTLLHQQENIDIYDFVLDEAQMQSIASLNKNFRICDKRAHTNDFDFFV